MSFKTAFFSFLKREKSQRELESYQRACDQVEDLEAAIQSEVLSVPVPEGGHIWDRPLHQQQAMALAWIARALSTVANTLLEVDAQLDEKTAGYLPLVTFSQARDLYIQVPEYVARAWEALANPNYRLDRALPLVLAPRSEADGKCPMVHLRGMQHAAEALDAFSEARLNELLATLRADGALERAEVKRAVQQLQQIRARARSTRTFAGDQIGAPGADDLPLAAHEDAETKLWQSLSDQFLLGQILAMPALVDAPALAGRNTQGRDVAREQRWFLSDAKALADLRDTKFGEQEIKEFWTRKGWKTTAREERYLAQCAALVAEGSISVVSRWSTCPFDPVYQTHRPVSVLDVGIDARHEFHLDMDEGKDELTLGTPRFRRTDDYEEEHEEGHTDDPTGG